MPKKEYLNDNKRYDLDLLKSVQKTNNNFSINHNEFDLSNSSHNKHLQKLLKAGLIKKHPVNIQVTDYDITKKGLERIKNLNQAQAKQDAYNRRYAHAFSYYSWAGIGLTLLGGIVLLAGLFIPLFNPRISRTLNSNLMILYVMSLMGLEVLLVASFFIIKVLVKHHFHVGSWKKVSSDFYGKYIIGE